MDLKAFSAFHFLHPNWLFAIPLLLLIAAAFLWRQRRSGNWSQVLDADILAALRLQEDGRKSSPWVLIGLAWTLAALALAGPAWRRVQSAAFRAPADWVIVLDLSPSMSAADLPPSRIMRAHFLIDDLLRAAQDARVGLIVFAGEAHTVVPLTSDVATIKDLLQPLVPSIMPESGHDIAPALDQAAALLRQAGSSAGRVIVLSDGFDDPTQALGVARRLKAAGAKIDVVGVGTPSGAPTAAGNGGFLRNAAGDIALSKLSTDLLERLAAAGGGGYWSVDALHQLIRALHAERNNPLEQAKIATAMHVDAWRNEGYWLILPILLLASMLARRGWL